MAREPNDGAEAFVRQYCEILTYRQHRATRDPVPAREMIERVVGEGSGVAVGGGHRGRVGRRPGRQS